MEELNLTIIIPHKNSTKTLIRLLDTIPSKKDVEIIVVDNGSNSESIETLKRKIYHENIKVFYKDSDGWAGKARNVGLEQALGKWILFADADDYFTEDMYSIT